MKNNLIWQVVIENPSFLKGEAVAIMVNRVAKYAKANNIIVDSIEGAGTNMELLLLKNFIISDPQKICEMLIGVDQIAWGDFFSIQKKILLLIILVTAHM